MSTTTDGVEGRGDRRSVRLPRYDYGSQGAYFVTIGTLQRRNLFGTVVRGEMRLSEYGRIADTCWRAIPRHFRHVELGAFVIMPNHMHGILMLTPAPATRQVPVGARHVVPLPRNLRGFGKPMGGTLGTIVQQYKSSVTREARAKTGRPVRIWQRNYYEHVIRSDSELGRLHRYIESNLMTWAQDEENTAGAVVGAAVRARTVE